MKSQQELMLIKSVQQAQSRSLRPRAPEPIFREARIDATHFRMMLVKNGSQHKVLNYSPFGILLELETQEEAGTEISSGVITVNNFPIKTVGLKHRWSSRPNAMTLHIGFSINGDGLCPDTIKAVSQVKTWINNALQENKPYATLPAEFRLTVLELREDLCRIQNHTCQVEKSFAHSPLSVQDAICGQISKITYCQFISSFSGIFEKLNESYQTLCPEQKRIARDFFREKLKEQLWVAPFVRRAQEKPLGYPGDYEMMNMLYRNELLGTGLFAKSLNFYFQNHPYSRAVRNRINFLSKKIARHLEMAGKERSISIMSVACGPARELESILKNYHSLESVKITLIDQDEKALLDAQRNIRKITANMQNPPKVTLIHASIARALVKLKNTEEKFDFIYSAGLFDYFNDRTANSFAQKLFSLLRTNGSLTIGNYTAETSSIMQMDLALDWQLIYRTPEDLRNLYANITSHLTIDVEEEGVNYFATLKST